MEKKLIVLAGPTATGKTKLGVLLAKTLDGEVVSADSMQLYRGMDIGTAKPSMAEREGIPHHLFDLADPRENFSVARYVEAAGQCVDDILARGKQPILVGGTGLYIEALCRGQHFADTPPETPHRQVLQAQATQEGSAALFKRLEAIDPESAARLHPNDTKRLIRALEVFLDTGKTLTQHNLEKAALRPRYARLLIGLTFAERADLRTRINLRVDEMLARGLLEEVRALLLAGVSPAGTAMQAIGYKELLPVLTQNAPLEPAIEEIKLRSRQYAKRQLTWFRNLSDIHWITWDKIPDFSRALQDSTNYFHNNGVN